MKTVPQFGRDPKIIAVDQAGIECRLQALASFNFVAIVTSAVKVPISALDRSGDNTGGVGVVNLPQAQADRRNLVTAGERDGFAGNRSVSVLLFFQHLGSDV